MGNEDILKDQNISKSFFWCFLGGFVFLFVWVFLLLLLGVFVLFCFVLHKRNK